MVFGGSVAARLLWRCDDGKSVGRERNAFPSNRNSVLKWSKQRNATRKERTTWDKAKADCGWSQVTSLQPQLFPDVRNLELFFRYSSTCNPLAGPPTTSTITHRVQSCARATLCLALIFRFQVQPRIGSDFLLRLQLNLLIQEGQAPRGAVNQQMHTLSCAEPSAPLSLSSLPLSSDHLVPTPATHSPPPRDIGILSAAAFSFDHKAQHAKPFLT